MTTPMENAEMEQHGVRFSSHNEEISPEQSLHSVETLTGLQPRPRDDLNPEAQEELQQLKTTLQNNIQSSRMQHHAFEPVSLPGSQPVSRVPSGTMTPSRKHMAAGSAEPSPRPSPPQSTVHSPPLTPAATRSRDAKASIGHVPGFRQAPDVMTPQRSASPQRDPEKGAAPTSRPGSIGDASGAVSSHPKQTPTFSIGPAGDSIPPSREGSPAATPGSITPGTSTPPVGPSYTRPFTPSGDRNDPYARNKREPPSRNVDSIDARFRFGNRDPRSGYSNSGSATSLPAVANQAASGANLAAFDNKRSSFFGGKKDSDAASVMTEKTEKSHGSKSNLKRFFKGFGSDHKHKEKHSTSRNGSTADGARTPPGLAGQPSVPFADDHGLQSKYGKFGKILGSGAGGSVRLMKRTGDGTTFAVKQFRDKHAYESEREYNKKVTAEFCIGSTLHHGNIIETIDIIHEKGKWYEVMEYAPFDLFATVMTGKMSRDEVTCSTLQILSGVTYLHSMGLAHRDLKLDNVVVNEHGIMKLIDFGSAVVFRYPFENDIVLATGVVGSDPYLAPEVYDNSRYDPQPADIWSIAIVFCCMTLRRFPWKAPRISDNSYRLFVSTPDPEQQAMLAGTTRSNRASVASTDGDERRKSGVQSEPASRNDTDDPGSDTASTGGHHHHHHHHHASDAPKSEPVSRQPTGGDPNSKDIVIKGPLRLLRLLPRETRHIMGRMLDLDPKKRATMDEILADHWVQNSLVCRQEEGGQIIRAPGHDHTLEPGGGGAKK